MTKVNDIGSSGASSTVYGGRMDVAGGGPGSSILDYDSLPKGMDDYVETAQREYLQRRGDLKQALAQTDDPAKSQQLQEKLDRLDTKFQEFRDTVSTSVEAGAFEDVEDVVGSEGIDAAAGLDDTERASDLNPGMVFDFRVGGPGELKELQGAAESFFDELQAGWDAGQPQRIDPPHVGEDAGQVDHNDFDRAAEQLQDNPQVAGALEDGDREKLEQMFDVMSRLRPQNSKDQQLDKIRG